MDNATTLPFTSRTRVALAIARGLAAARGDRDLTSTHIAIGILREGANRAVAALWYAGLSEIAIRQLCLELEHSLGEPPGRIPPRQVTVDRTPGEDRVIRLAELEAHRLADPYLGAEHILLAILRSDEIVAHRFVAHGVLPDQFYDGLSSVRRGDPAPVHPTFEGPAMAHDNRIPPGFYWRAPDGRQWFVAVANVTQHTDPPTVVPMRWELRFYSVDELAYSAELPNHTGGQDLTDDEIRRVYDTSGLAAR